MSKQNVVTASELQRSSGQVLRRVAQEGQHLIVERDGYRVAVMVPYAEYEALMQLRSAAAHRQMVRTLGARAEQVGLTEADALQAVETAKRQVYAARYRNARAKR